MKPEESEYWDEMAGEEGHMRDNIWKRQKLLGFMLEHNWIETRTLEIGVGNGLIASALNLIILRNWKYVGTDVSPKYCQRITRLALPELVNTDILKLPEVDGGFNRVIALDSLEHVPPDEREAGYKEIDRVMAQDATMIINMPLNPTYHNPQFDYPFDMMDIMALCDLTGLTMTLYRRWAVIAPGGRLRYAWIVLKRGRG